MRGATVCHRQLHQLHVTTHKMDSFDFQKQNLFFPLLYLKKEIHTYFKKNSRVRIIKNLDGISVAHSPYG